MGGLGWRGSAGRFASYLEGLASVIGHAGRVGPMRDYCTGLLLPCERKSVEPIAAATAPERGWAQDKKRRRKAGVPDAIAFQTKPKIALDQLAWACASGVPRGVVLMDSAYGTDASLRRGTRELCLDYSAAVYARTLVEASTGKK